jgi:glycosyltransferase involved in cell wall biosynthesis
MNSLVIPVYKNEANLERLLAELVKLGSRVSGEFEVVFVVDGSPDRSLHRLVEMLPRVAFVSRVLEMSRNFGAFAAIRAGLVEARGPYFAVMAADLQEPPDLVLRFFEVWPAATRAWAPATGPGHSAPLAARSHRTCSGSFTESSWLRICHGAESISSDARGKCATACYSFRVSIRT